MSGCGGGPALREGAAILVEPLSPVDQLGIERVAHLRTAAEASKLPGEGTVELSLNSRTGRADSPSHMCNDPNAVPLSIVPCAFLFVGSMAVVGAAVVTFPVWAVPLAIAEQNKEKPALSGQVTEKVAVGVALEASADWLREAVAKAKLAEELDSVHAASLTAALRRPVFDPSGQGTGGQRIRTGISQISLVEASSSDHFLMLCSRAMVEQTRYPWRYFQTCIREPLAPSMPPEQIKGVLMTQARRLGIATAKALTGESR
jgi:hypothetical protein